RLRFSTLVPTPAGSGGLRVASALYPRAPALRLSKFSLLTSPLSTFCSLAQRAEAQWP
ncbi:MAG: hypothetical protein RLZZ436_4276, partial [Planctomycetota bacterium]